MTWTIHTRQEDVMTRSTFIAQTAADFIAAQIRHDGRLSGYMDHERDGVSMAVKLADQLEVCGAAPWVIQAAQQTLGQTTATRALGQRR